MATLLLVDDNADFRSIFELRFTDLGYQVLTASDGVRGLQVVMDMPVDLILLDLSMPYRGGQETLGLIKSIQPQTPVLVLTGSGDEAAHARARAQGALDVLIKPIGMKVLAEKIAACLKRDGA